MTNLLKEKIIRGETTVGTFMEMGDASTAELLAMSKMDYAIIDTEHGPFDVESAMSMIRMFELHNNTALVRVKDFSRASILKMLDIGAKGIVIPQVHSVEQVQEIVKHGKFAPLGQRGLGMGRGAGFGEADDAQHGMDYYMSLCNSETMLIPQCETVGCLEHIEEIAKIEGIDGIFIGPFDLSVAMGITTQFDNPRFTDALIRIRDACIAAGKFCIVMCPDVETAAIRKEQGFNHFTIASDCTHFFRSLNEVVDGVNNLK